MSEQDKVKIGSIQLEPLEKIPAGSNPFNHDLFNMGTVIGTNLMVMMSNFDNQVCKTFILVHIPSGERILVRLPECDGSQMGERGFPAG